MALANVVGMVVAIQKTGDVKELLSLQRKKSIFGKLFGNFPDEKEFEGCYNLKMLMLDGYSIFFSGPIFCSIGTK